MSLILIPFGKGTRKFWIICISAIVIIFLIYIGYEDLALKINNRERVNPIMIFLAWLSYPIYSALIWFLNFMGKWGVLALIPIIIIGVILTNIYSALIKFIRKRKK